ncbi:LytR/AlgR family response regulator transcription factor [Arsenicibacter rosenii]|uniref:Response regulatory domain-containing protein n=1 Tax=Arsenicibacter rosenii TaxID=1750698 RepID=A0A1S2VAX8_9BACT|nr:response regulator transcription factor [Arsenicibacter rosenii]OIN55475.1 hypothetical protein BLX24_30205 [Arsenicibacter rosenii]
MKILDVLVVEDNLMTQAVIADTLIEAGHSVAGLARNFTEAMQVARNRAIDLAILDVSLGSPDGDGIHIARELQQLHNPDLIFITGTTDINLLERIKETSPASFLSKPFQKLDLRMQLDLISRKRTQATAKTDFIFIRDGDSLINIRVSSVVYAEAAGNYTCVYVLNRKKPFTITNNLQNVRNQYFPDLFRISRSSLINLAYLDSLGRDSLTVQLTDTVNPELKSLKISAEARSELLKRIPKAGAR